VDAPCRTDASGAHLYSPLMAMARWLLLATLSILVVAGCGSSIPAASSSRATPTAAATPTADPLAAPRAEYVAAEATWELAQSNAVDAVRVAAASGDMAAENVGLGQEQAAYVAFDTALTSLEGPGPVRADATALLDANGQYEAALSQAMAGNFSTVDSAQQKVKVALDAIGHDFGLPANFSITTPTP
jgi:hypothetical protein